MSENIQMICVINNRLNEELKVQSENLQWGKWYDPPNFKPVNIPQKFVKEAFHSHGRESSASGTQGTVVYQIGDNATETISISWDVTWAAGGSNKVSAATFNEDVAASITGFTGSGAVESVTITILDGR